MTWSPPFRCAALLPLALAVGAAVSAPAAIPVTTPAPLVRLEPKPVASAASAANREPSASAAAATVAASGVWAEVEAGGRRVRVRSGRRTIGVRPTFPSADLVLAVEDGGRWREMALVDETPEAEISDVTLAATAAGVRVDYTVVGEDGSAQRRSAEWRPEAVAPAAGEWRRLPDFPAAPGMAGVLAGEHGGVLVAAGGANFPEWMPWDGGTKRYYAEIVALAPGATAWTAAGALPAPRGYAAVVSLPQGVLVAGGENADTVFQDTLWLRAAGGSVRAEAGPVLPEPVTSATAVRCGDHVYLAGGYMPGAVRTSRANFWRLDPARPERGWETLPAWPGPARGMATIATLEGAVYLCSGLEVTTGPDGKARTNYLRDAYRYTPGAGWERLPDLPWSVIAAPSPAPTAGSGATGRIFVLGGVDGRQVGKAPRDSRVPEDILVYEPARRRWTLWPQAWPEPVVTTPAFAAGGRWHFVSGEIMAGVRTTRAWTWRPPETP